MAAAPGDPREGAAKAPGEGCRAAEDTAAPRRGGRAPTPGRGAPEPRARPPRGRRGNRSPGRSVGTCAPFPAARITQGGTAPLGTPVRPARLALPRGQPRSRLSSRPPFGARTRRTEWGGGGGGAGARVHSGVRDASGRTLPRPRSAPFARGAGALRARRGTRGVRLRGTAGGRGGAPGGGAGAGSGVPRSHPAGASPGRADAGPRVAVLAEAPPGAIAEGKMGRGTGDGHFGAQRRRARGRRFSSSLPARAAVFFPPKS